MEGPIVLELIEDEYELVIEQESADLLVDEDVLEVLAEAEQGPRGPEGPQSVVPGPEGPIGPVGPAGTAQSLIVPITEPAAVWVINHNTGSYPSITTIDTQGAVMYGDVSYPSAQQIRVEFLAAFAGTAYLN